MPIYEYACESCGHRFEVRQSFSDDPIADCTRCGAHVRRVLHPAGVIFKGSGWYATDSRSSSGGGPTATPGKSEPPKSETPSDSGTPADAAKPAAAAANADA